MSIRILVLCSTLGVGGAERQIAALVPRLRDRGFEPVVRTLRDGGPFFEELVAAGISTDSIGVRSRWDARNVARAYRLWRLQPDIVFTQSVDAQVIGHVIAHRLRVPHVTAHHSGPGILKGSHRMLLTRLLAPHVDRVIAVSEVQIPELEQLGYRHRAVRLIPNGTGAPHPVRPRDVLRAELGFEDSEFLAILVATLRAEKQVQVFIEAVGRAHAQDRRVRGLIVGGGPGLEMARAAAAEGGGVVHALGQRADIPDLLNAADCFCLSSDSEALPMSVIEAMSLRKPIVSTGVGGIADAVIDGQTGLLVPPRDPGAFADALLVLAADPLRAGAMGLAGYARFEDYFTVERMVDSYVDTLLEVVAHRAARRP